MVRKDKLDEGEDRGFNPFVAPVAFSHPKLAKEIGTDANYFESNKELCAILSFAGKGYSWVRESSRPVVKLCWDG